MASVWLAVATSPSTTMEIVGRWMTVLIAYVIREGRRAQKQLVRSLVTMPSSFRVSAAQYAVTALAHRLYRLVDRANNAIATRVEMEWRTVQRY